MTDYKVGDDVAIKHYANWSRRISLTIGKVERVTKTQVVAFDGRRFKKSDGFEVGTHGSRFHFRSHLVPLTDDVLQEARETEKMIDAEKKCRAWSEELGKARDADAVRLAALLPDLPK